jgi:transketolase
MSATELKAMAGAIRALAMDAVEQAKSGHPGMPMGMADVATVLFRNHLKFDPAAPDWPDRDRFVLSAGHGSMLLYALLHLTGYPGMTLDEIKRFRQLNSMTPGHPEYGHTPGVETTTGPLGQGLATAVGMAMAERMLWARFGEELVDHFTYVIAGDGCLMEGVSHEAIALAGKQKLEKLIVLWDDNSICIDGAVSNADTTDQLARFAAAGWKTLACDGHDPAAVDAAISEAKTSDRPVLIACKTIIGYGAPKKAGTKSAHGEALGAEELAAAKAALGWEYGPFEVPDTVRALWRQTGEKGAAAHAAWAQRLERSAKKADFAAAMSGEAPKAARDALAAHLAKVAAEKPAIATRAASGFTLDAIAAHWPELLGGSADLTGSNNTLAKGMTAFQPENPTGRYVHYGVREFGMAAAMNGLALHGGVVPYGGTFLVFSDYARPAIRLGAMMDARVIHVLTHDSIGLGEDGPTHQPVEHLAALRAIPGLHVFRPGDAVETAEAWAVALERQGPSVLALSRQATPALRTDVSENLTAKGAYEIVAASAPAKVSLFGTGTELALCVEAAAQLEQEGIPARVVSVPCIEQFLEQDDEYVDATIGDTDVRIVVEAGISQGWSEIVDDCAFIGMWGFGASAPAKDLYRHFGITTEAIVEAAHALL